MIQRKDREGLIRQLVEECNLHPVDAAEIVDISNGWSDGDEVFEPDPGPGDEPTPPRDDATDGPATP